MNNENASSSQKIEGNGMDLGYKSGTWMPKCDIDQ